MLGIRSLDFRQRAELARFLYFWREGRPVQLVLDVYEMLGWSEPYDPPGFGRSTIETDADGHDIVRNLIEVDLVPDHGPDSGA